MIVKNVAVTVSAKNAGKDQHTIIALHNHTRSSVLSLSNINTVLKKNLIYSIGRVTNLLLILYLTP